MPVPSSYNDITNNKTIRDFTGWAWYDRGFYADDSWGNRRVVLRIDSAHYFAIVVSILTCVILFCDDFCFDTFTELKVGIYYTAFFYLSLEPGYQ